MTTYEIKKSTRAKNVRITIYPDGRVVVTMPQKMNVARAEAFINEKKCWVEAKIALMERRKTMSPSAMIPQGTPRGLTDHKEQALALVHERLKHYNMTYGLSWNTVSVKNIHSRWGSCSKKGNLNFSYRIIFLPSDLADYLVVHELCHLAAFNHSKDFWNLVAKSLPDYQLLRRRLRAIA